ncbi:MAG: glycosyltransferase family 4 protein [Leptospirales bacterium]
MKILHLDCTTGFGGQERDHITEATGFLKKGHEYLLGVRKGTDLERAAQKECRTLSIPLRNNVDLKSLREIKKTLVDEKIDVLVTTSYIDSWLGNLAARSLGPKRPLIIRQRHILNPPHNLFPFRHMCDKLVVVSDALRLYFVERKLPFWHVVSIPRGVSPERTLHSPSEGLENLRKALLLPDDGPIALQVGTFQKDKGHFIMLDALVSLWKKIPDLVMVFLGEGPLRDEVIHKAEKMFPGLLEKRLFFRKEGDPAPYFSVASVVLVPSIRESLSLVTMESILHGVPVVAFRVGGIPEIFNRAPAGILVRPLDSSTFSEGVREVLSNPEYARKTQAHYASKIEHFFSIDQCVLKTELLYHSEIERLRSGRLNKNPYEDWGGSQDPFLTMQGQPPK